MTEGPAPLDQGRRPDGAKIMTRLNRETAIALALLVLCGTLWWASFDIRNPDYGTLAPAAWPQLVLAALTVFSLIYLGQSLHAGSGREESGEAAASRPPGLTGFLRHYRNPLWCYLIYLIYLATLPVFGALIGGVLLVFALLTALGGWAPRALWVHGAVALVSMGFMWSLFTFGLRVILPEGMILPGF